MTAPQPDISAIAGRLIAAYDDATTLPPVTATDPGFDVAAGYEVLREIETRRVASGWQPVGRKIGFTNRTIWPRYGVYLPMWAHVWAHTVRRAHDHRATLSLARLVQPRIEPEIVFGLSGAVAPGSDASAVLASTEWIAPGFEIVQSHFPDWKFAAADCTAAFGLHGALVVGAPVPVTERSRGFLAEMLPRFGLTLRRGAEAIDVVVRAGRRHVLHATARRDERVLEDRVLARPADGLVQAAGHESAVARHLARLSIATPGRHCPRRRRTPP